MVHVSAMAVARRDSPVHAKRTNRRGGPMQGTIQAVQAYDLHGLLYYHLRYVIDGEQQPREARLSHDMAYPDPRPGDRVEVHALLGIVDQIRRLEGS